MNDRKRATAAFIDIDALLPQNASSKTREHPAFHTAEQDAPVLSRITSGQDLLAQARTLTGYLREQPDGWLAAHRLMKSLRHDTLRAIPAPDAEGKTRIEPPRADQRAMLKRLYLQQSWLEITGNTRKRSVCHCSSITVWSYKRLPGIRSPARISPASTA